MINKNFIDGQLDECELLKDFIPSRRVSRVSGIYHQRVEYPPDEADKVSRSRTAETYGRTGCR
jgi:membrane-associated HD superfamily phosphohydrolase